MLFPRGAVGLSARFLTFHKSFGLCGVLDTEWNPDVDPAVLEANGLQMELMGHYGIEHNEFDIYKIYKK